MKKFLLFDLDGTISESAPGIMKSMAYGLTFVGIHENDEKVLRTFIGPPLNVRLRELYRLSEEDIATAVTHFRDMYENKGGLLLCSTYEGIGEVLKKAKEEGRILAVASSKPEPFVKKIIEMFSFTDYFTIICGSNPEDELKAPDGHSQKARTILKVFSLLEEKGFDRETLLKESVMIGDTHYDIEGAKETGIASLGVTYGYGKREELETAGADEIVDKPEEILQVMKLQEKRN